MTTSLLVQLSGGAYVEEASSTTVQLASQTFGSLLPSSNGNINVAVSPLTDIAAQIFQQQVQSGLSPNVTVDQAINNAAYQVSQTFGLVDVTGVLPAPATAPLPDNASGQYTLVLSALSQTAHSVGVDSTALAAAYAASFRAVGNITAVGEANVTVRNGSDQNVTFAPPPLATMQNALTQIVDGNVTLPGLPTRPTITVPGFNPLAPLAAPQGYRTGNPNNASTMPSAPLVTNPNTPLSCLITAALPPLSETSLNACRDYTGGAWYSTNGASSAAALDCNSVHGLLTDAACPMESTALGTLTGTCAINPGASLGLSTGFSAYATRFYTNSALSASHAQSLCNSGALGGDVLAHAWQMASTFAPVIAPTGGTYSTDTNVAITAQDANAVIYYTVDGSLPTSSSMVYSHPIPVAGDNNSLTIRTLAVSAGFAASTVVMASYHIAYAPAAAPTLSPNSGAFAATQGVVMATATSGAYVYYTADLTLDLTDPNVVIAQTSRYSNPVPFAGGVLRAVAYGPHSRVSAVTNANISVDLYVATTGSDTQPGTSAQPKATVQGALTALGTAQGRATVHVQQGPYTLTTPVIISNAIALLGGYNTSWVRQPKSFVTTLEDATPSGPMINFPNALSPSQLDGFVLNGNTGTQSLIELGGAAHVVSFNVLNGNSASDNYGIVSAGGSPQIYGNKLTLTSASGNFRYNIGVSVAGQGVPVVFSNAIDVSAAAINNDYGVVYRDGSSPIVSNNTIFFSGNGVNGVGIGHVNSGFGDPNTSGAPYIENNIIYNVTPSNTGRCIYASSSLNTPVSVKNNNLFGCSVVYDANGTLANSLAQLVNFPAFAANVNFNMIDGHDSYFVNEASDWHLTAGNANALFVSEVKVGGLSHGEVVSAYGFNFDLDGNTRTAVGNVGWSVGAYEKDD